MPDYTYLRQGNEPPSFKELRAKFAKLFLSEREKVVSMLIVKSKEDVENCVSMFYRNRRSCPQITKPLLFNKSYTLCDELSIKAMLASTWDYEHSKTILGPYLLFPSKTEVTSVVEDVNKELRDTEIILSVRYFSGGQHDYNTYIAFKVDANLGIL